MIRIPGKTVILRPLRPDELDLLVAEYQGPNRPVGVQSLSREMIRRRVAGSGRLVRGRLELGIEAEGRLVGDVDARSPASAFPPGVFEIGVVVFAAGDRGRGYGGEATRLIVDHLFDAEGAARVQATTSISNQPMRTILGRLGFAEEGILRSYFPSGEGRDDYVMYALTRSDWSDGVGPRSGEADRA